MGREVSKLLYYPPIQYRNVNLHILSALLFLTLIMMVSGAEHPIYNPESDLFRPVYSTHLTGQISPEHPIRVDLDIRDSETGFVRVYAWGENGTEWNLTGAEGYENFIVPEFFTDVQTGYPRILTLKNLSSEYLLLDPGHYQVFFQADSSEGYAEILVMYVYHEQIDVGIIENQTHSVFETYIPPGLERAIFMTESREGTNLDLFVQKGTNLPGSYEEFSYNATDECPNCWSQGIENYLSEMIVLDNPEPGPYLMVTRATGGDDFFYTYWTGIEKEK